MTGAEPLALEAADMLDAQAAAELKWARQLIDHAVRCLWRAGEESFYGRELADDAADALHAAGKLAPPPHALALFRLRTRLNNAIHAALDCPDDGTLAAISAAADRIKAALTGGDHD